MPASDTTAQLLGRGPSRTVIDGPDDLQSRVGHLLGRSDWLAIDQEMIDRFALVTLDQQWIHVDCERAAAGPFGTTVAHGYLTLSLCSHLVGQTFDVLGARMMVNYGLDRLRFPSPVRVGSRVRAVVHLKSLQTRDGSVDAVFATTVEIDGESKPACVAELVTRIYR